MPNRIIFLMCLLVIDLLMNACTGGQKQASIVENEPTQPADTHLGEHMRDIQYYTLKLGLAMQNKNAPLANFYLHEVNEAYEDLDEKNIINDGLDISGLLQELLLPALKMVDTVIVQNDTAQFVPVYHALLEKCNSCHRETKHEFIVIEMPSQSYNGQDFRAQN